MKKQMKTNLFAAALGISLIGVMLSSSTNNSMVNMANQVPPLPEKPVFVPAFPSAPFTAYLSLLTAFTNGHSIDFNTMDAQEKASIWDKMTNWREEQ